MSPIVARSVARLYGCKPNPKIDIFSKRLLYKFLGGRPITEITGIILVRFDGKYTRAYKQVLKIKKVCLRTYYIADHLKQPRGPHAARGLGSLGATKSQ